MSDAKWYCKGEIGEYILDKIDLVINGWIKKPEFVRLLKDLGLSSAEVKDLIKENFEERNGELY